MSAKTKYPESAVKLPVNEQWGAVEELRRKGLDQYLESIQSALKEYVENQKGE